MKLPQLLSNQEETPTPLFFAIHLADGQVQAVLWQVLNGAVKVVTQSSPHQWQTDEQCVEAVDLSLQELGKESENVKQALFALNPEWVDKEGIQQIRKPLFQKLVKELSLEAIGFVVTSEALVQYLAHNSEPQQHFFLIELTAHAVFASLVKSGQILQTEQVGRSGDGVSDLTEAFAHFTEKVFPTKFLLFSSTLSAEEVVATQQQLLGYEWAKHHPFMHPPIVEVYPPEKFLEVMVETGGKAVAQAHHLIAETTSPEDGELGEAELSVANDSKIEDEVSEPGRLGTAVPDNFKRVERKEATAVPDVVVSHNTQASTFGIPVSLDSIHSHDATTAAELDVDAYEDAVPSHGRLHLFHRRPILLVIIGVITGLALLALFSTVAARNMISANFIVRLRTQPVSQEIQLILDSQAVSSDVEKRVLKADVVKKEVSGQKTADSTGKKIIGDKAKGKITIFNRTSSAKSFSAGTVLASKTLKFTLDESVTVASASTGTNFETKPGTSEAGVTAAEIGDTSNIPAQTELTIESFSLETYVARTNAQLAGGTSREIRAVSQKDRDSLLATLRKELSDQAATELNAQAAEGRFIVPTNRVKVLETKYNAEVGKETNTFDLSLKMEAEALSYSPEDLKPLAVAILSAQAPANYKLIGKTRRFYLAPANSSTTSAQVTLNVNLSSVVQPVVQVEDWKKEVAGQAEKVAVATLQGKPQIESVQVSRWPKFFALITQSVPKQLEKITITITE